MFDVTWSPGTLGVMLHGRLVIIPSTVSTDNTGTRNRSIDFTFSLFKNQIKLNLLLKFNLEGDKNRSLVLMQEITLVRKGEFKKF